MRSADYEVRLGGQSHVAAAALFRWTNRGHGVIRRRVVPEVEEPPMSRRVRKTLLILHHHTETDVSCLENAFAKFSGTEIGLRLATCANAHGTEFLHQLRPIWPMASFLVCGKSAWFNIGLQHLGGFSWLTVDDTDLAYGIVTRADMLPLPIADRK